MTPLTHESMTLEASEKNALSPLIDYSQEGQALIIEQLITPDTPRIVVDIGAYDGVVGSNSRALILKGWRGLLVEPIPAVFHHLAETYRGMPQVSCVAAACGDRDGKAEIFLGKDRDDGQLASMSKEPEILNNLSHRSIQVDTLSLPTLLNRNRIPDDFGVLLVDTEGLDLPVLQGLLSTSKRPRVIVTEQFEATNEQKYELLRSLGYRFTGIWGSDSIWISPSHPASTERPQVSSPDVTPGWVPTGKQREGGSCSFDELASTAFGTRAVGWAFLDGEAPTDVTVVLRLENKETGKQTMKLAWRFARPDVASHFGRNDLLFSGFRAFMDLQSGSYRVSVVQQGNGYHAQYSQDIAFRA